MDSTIYHGEIKCEMAKCKNNAYYLCQSDYLCGVHSKSNHKRTTLPKRNPKEKATLLKRKREGEQEEVELHAKRNKEAGIRGKVMLTRLMMVKQPEHVEGFLKVFPNYKHQNRQDGFGCAALSPKSLGPVDHGQPGLPPSLSIENFHQYVHCLIILFSL